MKGILIAVGAILFLVIIAALMTMPSRPQYQRKPAAPAAPSGRYLFARIECTTEWSGYFGDHSVDGYRDLDVPITASRACVNAQLKTESGALNLTFVVKDDAGKVVWSGQRVRTTAAYGVVSRCFTDDSGSN